MIFGGAVGRAGKFPFKRAERAVKVGTEANKSELVQRPYGWIIGGWYCLLTFPYNALREPKKVRMYGTRAVATDC